MGQHAVELLGVISVPIKVALESGTLDSTYLSIGKTHVNIQGSPAMTSYAGPGQERAIRKSNTAAAAASAELLSRPLGSHVAG